jgi:pimeloyl-ACP methyl ester carboxylesterase
MSWACRWAASPRCISASAIPSAHCRWSWREKEQSAKFKGEVAVVAKSLLDEGMPAFAEKYAYGPTRVQFENKDPRGFAQFKKELGEHSALGSANTQIGCQGERPSLYDLVDKMRGMTTPTLILTGDEDWPCLAPSVMMKREIPTAALSVMPNCGHTVNIEDPDQFNKIVGDFIVQVDCGRWPKRDPRSLANSITGMKT